MASNKKQKKVKKQKVKSKYNINLKVFILLLIAMIACILYLPSAILFFIGMLPTFVAYLTDSEAGKNKTFTIGALNFAGCFYYLINIWSNSNPMEQAMVYLSDPMTIVIIYSAAGFGYIINYTATLVVASILRQKSLMRLDKLEEGKIKLEERWGKKVNGERPLDSNGFLMDSSDNKEELA